MATTTATAAHTERPLDPASARPATTEEKSGATAGRRFFILSSTGTALATFRARIEPRLSAAGIELRWSNALPDDLDGLGPREVLQIFRIVQEAVTNVRRHAGASNLWLTVAVDPPRAHVVVAALARG